MTLDEMRAELDKLEKSLAQPAQVISGGRTVQYATNQQKLEGIKYWRAQIADAESASSATRPSCGYSPRQVRAVYGGRGY